MANILINPYGVTCVFYLIISYNINSVINSSEKKSLSLSASLTGFTTGVAAGQALLAEA